MTDDHASDPRRRYSAPVVDGVGKAPSRSMLRATGFTDEDFTKPQVGIASTWSRVTPCNMHINTLADEAGRGADAAGARVTDASATNSARNGRDCPRSVIER